RAGIFYARFTATDQAGRKRDIFRALPEADTVPAAKKALQKLKDEAGETLIPVQGKCPTFADYATRYLDEVATTKRPETERKERCHVGWWKERLGALTLRQIHRTHVNTGIADLVKQGLAPRTVNLHVIALRGVLKRAMEEGLVPDLPTRGLRPLKVSQRKRELLPMDRFQAVLSVAPQATKNATEFVDYFRLLLYTGARVSPVTSKPASQGRKSGFQNQPGVVESGWF
ncbi:MAG: tyrosine-type recombinase/integrase, partial [Verrucomicrobiota bacterium]